MNFIDSRSTKMEVFQPDNFVTKDSYDRLNTPMTAAIAESVITLTGEWTPIQGSCVSFTLSADVATPTITFGEESYAILDSQGAAVDKLTGGVGQVLLFSGDAFYTLGGGSFDTTEIDTTIESINNQVNNIQLNAKNKINRTDTKTFFLEPSKWIDNKYTLDITGFGWTANTIIQINAPLPESNIELASGISIASQSNTQVVLQIESAPTEPVILTLLYGGEETSGYYCIDEIGEQTIIVQEEQVNNDIIVIANPTSSKTFENIHPNSTSFTSRNASNIYFNPGTLDFADIYVLYKYNGQIANLSCRNNNPEAMKKLKEIAKQEFGYWE